MDHVHIGPVGNDGAGGHRLLRAQMSEVKEKPPMYSYVSDWAIPRAQWGEMEKADAADEKMIEASFSTATRFSAN